MANKHMKRHCISVVTRNRKIKIMNCTTHLFSSFQLSPSVMSYFLQLHGLQRTRLPDITNPQILLKFMSIESRILSNNLMLCRPFLLLSSILPSIKAFSNELALCIRWPKYQSFNFSISPSNEYSGLISFRMDQLDLSPRDSHESSNTTVQKHQFLVLNFLYSPSLTFIHDYW